MDRKGISFTLTIVVSMMVVLLTAVSVVMIQQNYLGRTGERIGEGTEDRYEGIEISQLRSRCEMQKNSFCYTDATAPNCPSTLEDTQRWSCNLKVEGEWCYVFWEDNTDMIPRCNELEDRTENTEGLGNNSTGTEENSSNDTQTSSENDDSSNTDDSVSDTASSEEGSTDTEDSETTESDTQDTSTTDSTDSTSSDTTTTQGDGTDDSSQEEDSEELVTHPPLDDEPEYVYNWHKGERELCPEGYDNLPKTEVCERRDAESVENPFEEGSFTKICCKREDVEYHFVPQKECYVMEQEKDYETCEWSCVWFGGGCGEDVYTDDLTDYVGESGANVCETSDKPDCSFYQKAVCCGTTTQ